MSSSLFGYKKGDLSTSRPLTSSSTSERSVLIRLYLTLGIGYLPDPVVLSNLSQSRGLLVKFTVCEL